MQQFFCKKNDYERFIYVKTIVEKINEYINQGYIVFDEENEIILSPFEFWENPKCADKGQPMIKRKLSATSYSVLFGFEYDLTKGKIVIDRNKSQIKTMFEKYKMIHPKDIKNLKINKLLKEKRRK